MSQHYTKATVEVSEWCQRCHKFTPHRVLLGKLAGCKVCEAQPGKAKPAAPAPDAQRGLFDEDPDRKGRFMENRTSELRKALVELNATHVVACPTKAGWMDVYLVNRDAIRLPGAKHVYVSDHQADDRVCRVCGMLPGGVNHE